MVKIFSRICETIKRKRAMFVLLILFSIAISVLAVYSAISFDSIAITIDIGNVTFVKFLRGDSGIISFIFGTLISILVFYFIMLICCFKKFLLPFAILFYLYFVYSQMVIFTSIIVIYGFFNVLILILFLIVFYLLEFLLFILLILELSNISGSSCYFKDCFNKDLCNVFLLTIGLMCLCVAFCVLLMLLKSFVLLLVF